MYEELQVGLEGIVPPERMDVILDAYRQLVKAGLDAINDELLLVFNLQDGIADNAMFASRVEDCLMVGMIDYLRQHGIIVNISVIEMSTLVGMVQTLASFDDYLIPETLHDITRPDAVEPEVVLAHLVPLFSSVAEVEVMDGVVSVSPDVIARMHEVAEARMGYDVEAVERPADHAKRIAWINMLLRETERNHPRLVLELAEAGIPSGQTLTTLFEQVFEQLDDFKAKELGKEIVGLVLYSDTPLEEAHTISRALPQDFTDSHAEQNRIEYAIDQAWEFIRGTL
jgi:hypothetical protein